MYNCHQSGSLSTLRHNTSRSYVNESVTEIDSFSGTISSDIRRSELARFQPTPTRNEEFLNPDFGSDKKGWNEVDLSEGAKKLRNDRNMSSGDQFITDLRESVASGRSNGRSKRSRDRSRSRSNSRHRSSRGSKRSRSRSRDDRKRRERDRSEASQKSSQVSSSKSSSQRSTRERDDDSADSSMRLPFYLTQTPANIVVIKDLPKHCAEEDIRQEVEAFGAPIKNISIEQKSTPRSSRDQSSTRRVDPSLNTSLWAYLQFLRLEDAQRWMEQSQGRLRVRGEWVEMTYSETRTTSSRRSSRERRSSRKKGKRSRSSSRTSKRRRSRSRSRRRSRSRSRSRSGSCSRSTARRNRESREKSRERAAERDDNERERQQRLSKDWDCFNCNGRNYPRRQECYRCGLSREESERSMTDLSLQQISSKATKYLIIRELDALTTDETLHANLTRISPVFIKQAYISRDPVLQVSNGYAYVELSNEPDAEKLKAHLQQKNFTIDSKKVTIFFSKSCGDEGVRGVKNSNPPSLYNEPKVQGRNKLSEEDLTDNPLAQSQQSSPTTDQSTNHSAPHHQSAAAAQVTQTVNVNGQLYPVFPVPNTAQYVYDANSGYYYDHQTMLYYDANTRYYYNSTTQQFLYWDSNYSTYLPLPADKQQQKTSTTANNSTSTTASTQEQTPSKEGLTTDASRGSVSFTIGGKTAAESNKKMDKNSMAKKVREDMERWTKSVNQLKRAESNRVFPVAPSNSNPSSDASAASAVGPASSQGNSESSESWGAGSHGQGAKDIAFATLERRNMLEVGGDRLSSSNGNESEFKRVLLDTKPATALNPIGTFGHNNLNSDQTDGQTQMASAQFYSVSSANSSSTSFNQPPVISEPKATVASEEVRLTDWVKMACLLCKRQFKDREGLVKHQRMSDMHKSNMEQHMKTLETTSNSNSANGGPQSSSLQANSNEEEYDSLASMFQYRDRAKERREKHGISAPPLREYEKAYSSSSNQPAQSKPEEPIGSTNVGNKLMQAMGWKEGEGLGKSKQGITAPIKAAGRESTAGLGAVSYTRDPNKTYAENARQALLSRVKND